jgi:hypothetical protein
MAIKTFTTGEVLTAADTNTYLANSGLVFVKQQTIGSGVSSVTVSDAFSSTYDNYKILISGGASSGSDNLTFQFAGITTTNYYGGATGVNYLSSAFTGQGINAQTKFPYAGWHGGANLQAEITVHNAFLAKNKWFHAFPVVISGVGFGTTVGECNIATSQTGFVITPTSGTLSGGIIVVYGYRKE